MTIALLQMAFICPVCYLVARPRLSVDTARLVAPLALVSVLNLVCGLVSALLSSYPGPLQSPVHAVLQSASIADYVHT